MFREIRRIRQKMTEEECIEVLKNETRGVLSVTGLEGYPYGMPMNHWYDEETGKLWFHGGKFGHKIDAIRENPKVSYCVYDKGFLKEGDWALNVHSVIIFGTAELIDDPQMICDISRKLCYKFTDDESYIEKEMEQSAKNTLMICVTIDHMSGKLVNEK